jgi:outer membrane protein OmpA-like peptidoglycan-associated protein
LQLKCTPFAKAASLVGNILNLFHSFTERNFKKKDTSMTRTLLLGFISMLLCVNIFAQEVEEAVEETVEDVNDTWRTPTITDEMTVDSDQNKQWRMGEEKFSAKPKNAWELGITLGHFHINGDVVSDLPSGFGIGLHLRKAINYFFSWRLEAMYSKTSGLDDRLQSVNVLRLDNRGIDFSPYGTNGRTYRNFKTSNIGGDFSILFNFGNLLFHKQRNKWNGYVGLGVGLISTSVEMNYFNDGAAYDWSSVQGQENSRAKRSDIKALLDDSYESSFENDRGVNFFHDNGSLFPTFVGTLGISRKIGKRFNLSLEHQIFAQDYDQWDGHEYRTTFDQTNDSDIGHYTNIRFAFNLGNFDKVSEPLYWLNPLDGTMNDIANLKQRPQLDLEDTDGDGIIDMLDQEPNTADGCPVDTRGVTLDSDGDGLADCKDAEIYSPPGYPVDGKGIAQVPVAITTNDVNDIVDTKIAAIPKPAPAGRTGCSEWFLPMIHFDNDKYTIKSEFYGQLHHVAEVMTMCPEVCVTAHGHTDPRNSNEYNNVLSYNRANGAVDYLVSKYGIDRSRFNIMYGGEDSPLVSGNSSSQNYMNRRVEFRVCKGGDSNMGRPAGVNAGSAVKTGGYFNGNKNSGY